MTGNEQVYKKELARTDQKNIPVNLVYPADYPNSPAIMLGELIGPADALKALNKIAPETDEEVASKSDSRVADK